MLRQRRAGVGEANIAIAAASYAGDRNPHAKTRKGASRAAQILQAALATIAEAGYRDLTLDTVAARVGISKGNLQYYFPTRASLLHAAFAEQVASHRKAWSDVADRPAANGVARLRRQIAFELAVNRDRTFVAQVMERWLLSERNEALRSLTADWHNWVTGEYARLIAGIRPRLAHRVRHQLGIMIYAMVVGLAPYLGQPDAGTDLADFEERIANTVLDMIASASGGSR